MINMAIVIKNNIFAEAVGLEFEGKVILKAMSAVISDGGLDGFNCIFDDASTGLVPMEFFEEALDDKIYYGVV
jgi:hypothetical protein